MGPVPDGQDAADIPCSLQELHAGLTEGSFDHGDPAFAPIEGVDLDGYAKAVAAITRSNAGSRDAVEKVAESVGVPAGKWKAVNDGWIARMRQNRAVMNRYGVIFGKY